jgi:hypothetical protein
MMKPTINVACQTHRMLEMKRYGIINDQKVNIPKRFLCIHKLQIFTYINAERIFIVQKKKDSIHTKTSNPIPSLLRKKKNDLY